MTPSIPPTIEAPPEAQQQDTLPSEPDLGKRVQARREQLGVSRRALAKELGFAHSTIVRIENGVSYSPRMDVLLALAKGLRVNVLWLMAGSDTPAEGQ